MSIEWSQVLPAGIVGGAIVELFRYVFVHWYEKRHLDQELDRGAKAMSLAEQLLALHEKACDRNVGMKIPLGKRAIELLPVTDDELAEDEEERLELMEVGQSWLVSLMWNCVNLMNIRGEHLSVDEAIEHAENSYRAAYDLMNANALMQNFGDITLTQMVHAYYCYLTQGSEANADAVVKAMENWVNAHANDDSD